VALIGGMIILGEQILAKELIGCILVLVAVFIAQFERKKKFLELKVSKFFVDDCITA
jgi:drug/metabolite transporter (DMT)-like permease